MVRRTGCWLWNSNPQPNETVTWSGACPRGPAEGQGSGEWRSQDGGAPPVVSRFSGQMREGRLDGQASVTWPHGNRYEGEWRDDRADGQGAHFIAAEQRWYRGAWFSGCHLGPGGARASIARPLSSCP
ncbi:hypothetical protein [Sediminicoccus sp. BL-A-41-H5]|uniref:hypothetical protein n=1 Tax=Sediminicoccus sp. BL-A-41-H5 TaxID=3421106 RepID=UPI003D67CF35